MVTICYIYLKLFCISRSTCSVYRFSGPCFLLIGGGRFWFYLTVRCKTSIQEARNHQYCRRVPGSSITALHSTKVDRSSVYSCSTPERREPLDLRGLDVASVRMGTSTICCRTLIQYW